MPRFSLKTLLIAAAVSPVAVFALAKATPTIASLVMTGLVFIWIGSVLTAQGSDGELREVARGFAVSSLAFAVVAFIVEPTIFGHSLLFTTHMMKSVHEWIVVRQPKPRAATDFPLYSSFAWIGRSYWTIIIGLAGGWFAGWLYRRRQRPNSQPSTEASWTP